MKSVCCVVLTSLLFVACGSPAAPPASAPAPASAGPTPQPYGNLAQVMRAIPFPELEHDLRRRERDPAAKSKKKPAPTGGGGSASANYGEVYGGWQGVEQAAIALSETANLDHDSRAHVREREARTSRQGGLSEVRGRSCRGWQGGAEGSAIQESRQDARGRRHGHRSMLEVP